VDADSDGVPDEDANGVPVVDKVYLVNLDGDIRYYEVSVNASNQITDFIEVTGAAIPESIKPPVHPAIYGYVDEDNPTATEVYEAELQNFVNWYSFYRRRELTAKAAIGEVIDDLRGVQVGIHYINRRSKSFPVEKVRVTEVDDVTAEEIYVDKTASILARLYDYDSSGSTPLRRALQDVGEYYDQEDGNGTGGLGNNKWGPWYMPDASGNSTGGECQQSFAVLFTDGFYNGSSPNVGNQDTGVTSPLDQNNRQLFADSYSNTLADVAMEYYKNDLSAGADGLADRVPTNDANNDVNQQQHMVTYTVAFGLKGTLNQDDYMLYNEEPALLNYPVWPYPDPDSNEPELIDDLWHAAVNSRGMYLSAENPEMLVSSLVKIMQNLVSRIGSGSSLSINGEELHTGTVMYQASYSTDGWWGDVKAHAVSPITGMVTTDTYLWSASEALGSGSDWDTVNWDTGRNIATFDPDPISGGGLAFRWASLTTDQQAQLNDNPLTGAVDSDGLGEDRLEYIRGSNAKEKKKFGGIFRDRYSKLGDIVHSAPFYVGYVKYEDTNGDGVDEEIPYGVLYANANDGMMHAFHDSDGHELFGYVPNLVFDHLNMLPVAEPNFQHMYYLDLTPQIKEIGAVTGGVFHSEKLLVSGLGKGGKGYFCLDVTDPENNTEVNAGSWVKWEYPQQNATAAEKDNMGYSFSEAYFVKSYATSHEWVVVFGNGYASASGTAALYVVDARSGELLNMIDTGMIGNNGLSTPTPIDINGDRKVDYVYAGDLLGNVWKFDLTDTDPANWGSAYLDTVSGDPEPLFTARGRTKNPDGSYVDPPNIYAQPITTKLNVIKHCDVTKNGFLVLFGTGKYLSTADADNTQYQTIYGVWDYGQTSDEYLGVFNRGGTNQLSNQAETVTLLEQTIVHWNDANFNTWLRVLSDHEPTWATDILGHLTHNAGWYVDLPLDKERVIRNSFVRDGKLIMITSIPEDDPCAAGGDSIVHEMNACSGGRLDSAQFDANGDGIIDENDLIQIQNPDWSPGSGLPEFITVPPTGIKYDTMMYPPIILTTPGGLTERKYFSTAAGNISTLEEQSERRGMFYWRKFER